MYPSLAAGLQNGRDFGGGGGGVSFSSGRASKRKGLGGGARVVGAMTEVRVDHETLNEKNEKKEEGGERERRGRREGGKKLNSIFSTHY